MEEQIPQVNTSNPENNMPANRTGKMRWFAIVPVIAIALTAITAVFKINGKSSSRVPLTPSLAPSPYHAYNKPKLKATSTPVALPTASTQDAVKWMTHRNQERGITFDIPEDWEIVYAEMGENFEIDAKNRKINSLVLIGVYTDKRIVNGLSIQDALKEKEDNLRSRKDTIGEISNLADFKSQLQGDTITYSAQGEEQSILLSEDVPLEQMKTATYNFQELGSIKTNGKVITLHGITLPENHNDSMITRILTSFKIQ